MTTWECKEAIVYPLLSFSTLTKNVVAVYSYIILYFITKHETEATATEFFINEREAL